jgi:hypothetical protein
MENKINGKSMLTIASSISMILLSVSAFILSVNKTFAEPAPKYPLTKTMIDSGTEIYPFGVVSGKAYWIE